MLDAEDFDTVLHMLDLCHGEGLSPPQDKVRKLLRKLATEINSTKPLEPYSGIPAVDQIIKEMA